MICSFCGAPVVRAAKNRDLVHDATLAELRVSPAEFSRVQRSATLNAAREKEDRVYGLALHIVEVE